MWESHSFPSLWFIRLWSEYNMACSFRINVLFSLRHFRNRGLYPDVPINMDSGCQMFRIESRQKCHENWLISPQKAEFSVFPLSFPKENSNPAKAPRPGGQAFICMFENSFAGEQLSTQHIMNSTSVNMCKPLKSEALKQPQEKLSRRQFFSQQPSYTEDRTNYIRILKTRCSLGLLSCLPAATPAHQSPPCPDSSQLKGLPLPKDRSVFQMRVVLGSSATSQARPF